MLRMLACHAMLRYAMLSFIVRLGLWLRVAVPGRLAGPGAATAAQRPSLGSDAALLYLFCIITVTTNFPPQQQACAVDATCSWQKLHLEQGTKLSGPALPALSAAACPLSHPPCIQPAGELLIYIGFQALALHWLPLAWLATMVLGYWVSAESWDTGILGY